MDNRRYPSLLQVDTVDKSFSQEPTSANTDFRVQVPHKLPR